jgi:ABC-type nickel/cobalt efflux system permease component RcnA
MFVILKKIFSSESILAFIFATIFVRVLSSFDFRHGQAHLEVITILLFWLLGWWFTVKIFNPVYDKIFSKKTISSKITKKTKK